MIKSKGNLLAGIGLGIAGFMLLVSCRGLARAWEIWSVPVGMQSFLDLRVITSGARTHGEGRDPMLANPDDISGRKLNYPRIWQMLYALGIGPEDTDWLGAFFAVLFLAGVILATPPLSNGGVGWLLPAVFSPAVMLGMERGNTDLLIFFLLALAITVRRTGWSLALVLSGYVLKLFPLVAVIMVAARDRATAKRASWIAAGFALLYFCFSLDDLILISANTPRAVWLSYGRNVFWMKVAEVVPAVGNVLSYVSNAAVVMILMIAGLVWLRRSPRGTAQEGPGLDAFRVGAACYVGSFLAGNSFNYRLMFLLLALPQLLAWSKDREMKLPVRLALAGIYLSLWSLGVEGWLQALPAGIWAGFALSEAAHWGAFGALLYLLCRTWPGWAIPWAQRTPRPGAPDQHPGMPGMRSPA